MPNVQPDVILAQLLENHHGWWYDYVDKTVDYNGRERYSLRGTPQYSPTFLKLYGIEATGASIRNVIHDDDRKRIVDSLRRVSLPDSTPSSDTVRAFTANGEERIVEVYVRRIALEDGVNVIASFHSDVTESNKALWLFRTIVDKMNAFVFVKRWDSIKCDFVFEYVNDSLAKEFRLDHARDAIGKSDRNFFASEAMIAGFRRDDEAVLRYRNDDEKRILIREETFSLVSGTSERRDRHLLTFKALFTPPLSFNTDNRRVLGVSVDVTDYTDLLRSVVELPDKAIYIKDSDSRYVVANSLFANMLGARSVEDIKHKTFEEVCRDQVKAGRMRADVADKLISDVDKEDALLKCKGSVKTIRTAELYDNAEWVTEKRLFPVGQRHVPHILGVSEPLFPGQLGEMLDKMPQCVAVKRFHEDNANADQFRYVWANSRYLSRHGLFSVEDVVGKTDFTLSGDITQANRFRAADMKAIEAGRQLLKESSTTERSSDSHWSKNVEMLKKMRLWEFRETLRAKGIVSELQTTKWAECLYGKWFVVVVYSDVTDGFRELQRYHSMTVHAVRGAIAPLEITLDQMARIAGNERSVNFDRAVAAVRVAKDQVSWFVKYHQHLLEMRGEKREVRISELGGIVESESMDCRIRCRVGDLRVTFRNNGVKDGLIHTDVVFFRAIVSEVLRNAVSSIIVANASLEAFHKGLITREGMEEDGWEKLEDRFVPRIISSIQTDEKCVRIDICDNGAASLNSVARKKFQRRFNEASVLERWSEDEERKSGMGLFFCHLSARLLGGTLSCRIEDRVRVSLELPWSGVSA